MWAAGPANVSGIENTGPPGTCALEQLDPVADGAGGEQHLQLGHQLGAMFDPPGVGAVAGVVGQVVAARGPAESSEVIVRARRPG